MPASADDKMTEQLPRLKADWILSGDTPAFLSGLDALAMRGWRVAFAKYEPVREALSNKLK
jgi:hypothetical protein